MTHRMTTLLISLSLATAALTGCDKTDPEAGKTNAAEAAKTPDKDGAEATPPTDMKAPAGDMDAPADGAAPAGDMAAPPADGAAPPDEAKPEAVEPPADEPKE